MGLMSLHPLKPSPRLELVISVHSWDDLTDFDRTSAWRVALVKEADPLARLCPSYHRLPARGVQVLCFFHRLLDVSNCF
jgi:hypothetical protein